MVLLGAHMPCFRRRFWRRKKNLLPFLSIPTCRRVERRFVLQLLFHQRTQFRGLVISWRAESTWTNCCSRRCKPSGHGVVAKKQFLRLFVSC